MRRCYGLKNLLQTWCLKDITPHLLIKSSFTHVAGAINTDDSEEDPNLHHTHFAYGNQYYKFYKYFEKAYIADIF